MPRHLMLAFLSFSTISACSTGTTTAGSSSVDQALEEAAASAEDAKATAEACFAAFETCKSAADADASACKTQLDDCLPAEAHPGPRCGPPRGKGRGSPHGPNGGACDGGGPPPNDGDAGHGGPPPGGPDGPGHGGPPGPPPGTPGEGGSGDGKEPDFCARVPLPPPAALEACHDALDACLDDGSDRKTCEDAHQACVKAAFDAARADAGATAD